MNSNPAKTRRLGASTSVEPPLSRDHPEAIDVPFWSNPLRALRNSKVNPGWLAVPALGYFIEVLSFAQTPEQLDRVLNMLVLVNALMLGVVGSMMTGFDFDEMQTAMRRWSSLGDLSWSFCWDAEANAPTANLTAGSQLYCDRVLKINGQGGYVNGYAEAWCIVPDYADHKLCTDPTYSVTFDGDDPISEIFGELFSDINTAILCLSSSLLMAFFLYLTLSATSFKGHSGRFSEPLLSAWYFGGFVWAILLGCVVLTISGVITTMKTLGALHLVKSPHPGIEIHADRLPSADWLFGYATVEHGARMQNPYVVGMWIAAGICITLIGIGNCRKARAHREAQQDDREDTGRDGPGFGVEAGRRSDADTAAIDSLRGFIEACEDFQGPARARRYAETLFEAGITLQKLTRIPAGDRAYADQMLDKVRPKIAPPARPCLYNPLTATYAQPWIQQAMYDPGQARCARRSVLYRLA